MDKQLFYTGGYASESDASICLWEIEKHTGRINKLDELAGFLNPSYLIISKNGKNLYAISEFEDAGEVLAFSVNQESRLSLINRLPIKGKITCHLAVNDALLVAANYGSGSLSVLLLDENGGLKESVGEVINRPSGGRAHFVTFCGKSDKLLAVDLGLDKVFVYHADRRTGMLTELENEGVSFPKGSGPRHLIRRQGKEDVAYVVGEYSSQVYTIKFGDNPQVLQYISALPGNCTTESCAAAIKLSPDGKRLYTSNRGFDSIAVFNIKENGLLELVGIVPVKGSFPRDFFVFDSFAVILYQKSDLLEVFTVDSKTGLLHETGITAEAVSPVCICPVL